MAGAAVAFEITLERAVLVVNTAIALAAVIALVMNVVSLRQSRRAVVAAEEAAKAANRSADTQAAALDFDFACAISVPADPDHSHGMAKFGYVMLECRGARLYVHGLVVLATYEGLPDGFTLQVAQHNISARTSEPLPHLLHAGDSMTFGWPKLPATENRLVEADLTIEYSFDPERGPVRKRDRRVPIRYTRTTVPTTTAQSERPSG
jgi:hypothetical protein